MERYVFIVYNSQTVSRAVRASRSLTIPPICKVCASKDRKTIDGMLLDGSTSLRDITTKYGIPKTTLHRHRVKCQGWMPTPDHQVRIQRENERRELMAAPSRLAAVEAALPNKNELGDILGSCISRLDVIVARCEENGADAIAISGIDAIRKQVGDLARIAGHIGTGSQTNVNVGVSVSVSASDIGAALAQHLSGGKVSRSDAAKVLELTANE